MNVMDENTFDNLLRWKNINELKDLLQKELNFLDFYFKEKGFSVKKVDDRIELTIDGKSLDITNELS